MSVTAADCSAEDAELCTFPEFELCGLLDDEESPADLTVYPAGADEASLATSWLTIDVDATVALVEAR